VTLADVSGLESVRDRLREGVVTPVRNDRFSTFGASGVLVYGPTGVGKTHLAEALVGELGVDYVELTPSDIPLGNPDEGADYVQAVYETIVENAPCVLLVDGLETIAPSQGGRFESNAGPSQQVNMQLCSVLDELDTADEEVVFVGTTTELSAVDERVRRAGCIDVRIGLERPDETRRRAVLRDELARVEDAGVSVDRVDIDIERISGQTGGMSVAGIVSVIEEAVRSLNPEQPLTMDQLVDSIERLVKSRGESDDRNEDGLDFSDFVPRTDEVDDEASDAGDETDAFASENGRSGDSIFGDVDGRGEFVRNSDGGLDVTFEDVGGLNDVEQRLREMVVWPRKYPEYFEQLDIDTSRGVLLYGPPGTGKTLLDKAVANETESSFLSVSGPKILDCYVGESAKFVRELFGVARDCAPSVIFVDEIDAIAGARGGYSGGAQMRDSIVNQFLSEMDGLTEHEDVVVIGATNRVDVLDAALRRPGRFGAEFAVPLPTAEARREILEIHTAEREVADDVDIEAFVDRLEGHTGAEIGAVCEEAAIAALHDRVEDGPDDAADDEIVVQEPHFERALETIESTRGDTTRPSNPSGPAFQ